MKRGSVIALTAIWVIFMLVAYSPTFLYIADSAGYGIAKSEINGIHIETETWWVPIVSRGSKLRPFFHVQDPELLVFIKAGGVWPGVRGKIFITRTYRPPSENMLKEDSLIHLTWGDAYVVNSATDDPKYQYYFVRRGQLLIGVENIDFLKGIRNLR